MRGGRLQFARSSITLIPASLVEAATSFIPVEADVAVTRDGHWQQPFNENYQTAGEDSGRLDRYSVTL